MDLPEPGGPRNGLVQVGEERRQRGALKVEGLPVGQMGLDLGQPGGAPELAQPGHRSVHLVPGAPGLRRPLVRGQCGRDDRLVAIGIDPLHPHGDDGPLVGPRRRGEAARERLTGDREDQRCHRVGPVRPIERPAQARVVGILPDNGEVRRRRDRRYGANARRIDR